MCLAHFLNKTGFNVKFSFQRNVNHRKEHIVLWTMLKNSIHILSRNVIHGSD
eukprot:22406_2